MRRSIFILVTAGLLSAWADGQTTPRFTADRVRLLHTNASLLEDLVTRAVALSNAGTRVERATECRLAVGVLGQALQAAAEDPAADPDRIAELADQVADLWTTGLLPLLEAVREQVRSGSLHPDELSRVEVAAQRDLTACREAMPTDGRVGTTQRVRQARLRLSAVADR